ncbi:uncharacterized protein LOC132701268 [Cylas formicarius]|uniref:uncharacterized protein LOC132701268 n=1 Tax=Cylas formicarius TaxID=197179 RepID=UPI0029588185|nr:uncharacterized protein LOC132701268 [Cylas formicarius]
MSPLLLKLLMIAIVLPLVHLQTYECTAAGKFRYQDATCRSFYMCVFYNGAYVRSDYTCPSNSVFDGSSQTCSNTAICIDNLCDNVPLTPLLQRLADPNAVNCTTYIMCAGLFPKYPVLVSCPNGYYYNQALEDCWITPDC